MNSRFGHLFDVTAEAALLGWPIDKVLGIDDPIEQMAVIEVLQRAINVREKRRKRDFEDLATTIQNAVARAFGAK